MNSQIDDLKDFDAAEVFLIEKFRKHAFFKSIATIPEEAFRSALLQKMFHAFQFSPLVDFCINRMKDSEARSAAREIIREEYPSNTEGDKRWNRSSHREDLFHDLLEVGFTEETLWTIEPTAETTASLAAAYGIVRPKQLPKFQEIAAITFMRFWGEVLVAEEYEAFKPRLQMLGLKWDAIGSTFYREHFLHDKRWRGISEDVHSQRATHSEKLGAALADLLDTPEKLNYAADLQQEIAQIKSAFYDQFVK